MTGRQESTDGEDAEFQFSLPILLVWGASLALFVTLVAERLSIVLD